jgi:hypothetical protein
VPETLTGRERAIRAMYFEPTDRLPIMGNGVSAQFVQWFLKISEDEYWSNQRACHWETMRKLRMDFHIQMWFPPREQVHWCAGEEMAFGDDVDAVLANMTEVAGQFRQQSAELEKNREQRIQEIVDYQIATQQELGDEILWIFGMDEHGPSICHLDYFTYGYEGLFLAIGLQPDVVSDHIGAQAKLARVHNECVAEAARRLGWPKIGYTGTDVTTQRSNMVRPEVMEEIYFPHLDYALQPLIEDDFKIIWHSDGYMNDMIPPLIDIGIAGFQGFQEECGTHISEVARKRNRNGEPLILWGSCSVLEVIGVRDFNDIQTEVRRVLDEWPHPGLCLATPTYLDEGVPNENIVEYFRCCREFGSEQRGL